MEDKRFAHIHSDPRFKRIPKYEQKVKIDKRFKSMFNDKQFQIKYNVDKRGRPVDISGRENLKKYYELSSESEEDDGEVVDQKTLQSRLDSVSYDGGNEDVLKINAEESSQITDNVRNRLKDMEIDYARGDGRLLTDSSSDDDSDSEGYEEVEHEWGELDKDAETTEEITNRLAICNMDWDRIRAEDLMVLFSSFLPSGGLIHSITVYPSDYGIERIKEEDEKGPPELIQETDKQISIDDIQNEDDEERRIQMEKLRKYQLNRLKYYYAVMICDSPSTANAIYSECDGLEYESSTNRLDLRFIPDDTTFEQEARETCTSLPDMTKYKPRLFTTTALTQAKVELTWDETDPDRAEAVKSLHNGHVDESNLREYLACSSSEEETDPEDEQSEPVVNEEVSISGKDAISKYKELLASIEEDEEKSKRNKVEMVVSWDMKLEEKTSRLVEESLKKSDDKTPFQLYLDKRKEKKKKKKEERKKEVEKEKQGTDINDENEDDVDDQAFSDDDIPSDVDLNDEYFKEEIDQLKQKKKKKKKKLEDEVEDPVQKQKQAQLELLMLDSEEETCPKHFSLKKIEENEKPKKKKKNKFKKGKKRSADEPGFEDDFKMDVKDERFSALFTSHHYNIDPADSQFKATKGMQELINEKLKRRQLEEPARKVQKTDETSKRKDPQLSILVKNIKRNTMGLK